MSDQGLRWRGWPHVLEMQQFSAEVIEDIISQAQEFEELLRQRKPLPRFNIDPPWRLRTLFYEGSTRTETAFKDAAVSLGISIDPVPRPDEFSSAVKGEDFEEAIAAYTRTGGMGHLRGCDCIVVRRKEEGASAKAAAMVDTALGDREDKLPLPVINAGDGKEQHPTQGFSDFYTFYRERAGTDHPLKDITVLFAGDLSRSRVVNSILYGFGHFAHHGIRVIFCCPPEFKPKQDLLNYLARHGVGFEFTNSMGDFPEAIRQADIIYLTRVQREREEGYPEFPREAREALVFQARYLNLLKPGAFVTHPLPINRDPEDPPAEIDVALMAMAQAGDRRCAWMRHSHRGFPVRASLLYKIFQSIDGMWRDRLGRSI